MHLSKLITSASSWIREKLSKSGTSNTSRQESLDHSQLQGLSESGSSGRAQNSAAEELSKQSRRPFSTSDGKTVRIALFAGPGAAKTTLAMAFTAFMKDRGYNWHYVHEYARDFIDTYGSQALSEAGPLIQCKFMDRQINLERKLPAAADGWITDSPVFLGWMYASKYSDIRNAAGFLDVETYIALKDCYKGFLRSLTEYDYFVHVKREKPYVKDGTRTQTENEAKEIDGLILTLLKLHNVKVHEISGTTEQRCHALLNLIEQK